MAMNYNDQLKALEEQEEAALKANEEAYAEVTAQSDALYDQNAAMISQWEQQQKDLANQNKEFQMQQIQQQQDQAEKDYEKEQRAAYADWQKQSGKYGVAAEQMAASGLTGSGYSESSQVAMYTSYQKRLVAAKESMDSATLAFNNAMQEAQRQNSSQMAKIAFTAFQNAWQNAVNKLNANSDIMAAQKKAALDIQGMYDKEREAIISSDAYKKWKEQQIQPSPQYDGYFAQFQSADPTKTINMTSVLELGYGRITPQELNNLLESGAVEAYVDGGEIYYRRKENNTPETAAEMTPNAKSFINSIPVSRNAPQFKEAADTLLRTAYEAGKLTDAEALAIMMELGIYDL